MLVSKSHQANEPVQISIDKEELKLIPAVANHPSLSDEANWYMSSVIYKHATGDARLAAGFKSDFTQTVDVPLKSNMTGGDSYELHEILVSGANRSPLISIKRSDIANVSAMDLILASTYPINVNWNSVYGINNDISLYQVSANGAITGGDFGNEHHWAIATDCPAANEDGEYTFVVDANGLYGGYAFGIKSSFVTPPPFNQGGVGFTGLIALRNYGASIATIWVSYNNGIGPQVQWTEWDAYGTNTVVFKRETTSPTTSDFSIKVNGTEVYRNVDLYRNQPFQPGVCPKGQPFGGTLSAQRTA